VRRIPRRKVTKTSIFLWLLEKILSFDNIPFSICTKVAPELHQNQLVWRLDSNKPLAIQFNATPIE
jgi:hypothetical protein